MKIIDKQFGDMTRFENSEVIKIDTLGICDTLCIYKFYNTIFVYTGDIFVVGCIGNKFKWRKRVKVILIFHSAIS